MECYLYFLSQKMLLELLGIPAIANHKGCQRLFRG